MSEDEALALDELVLSARRARGRRIEKSDLLRALLTLATTDETTLSRALDTLPAH